MKSIFVLLFLFLLSPIIYASSIGNPPGVRGPDSSADGAVPIFDGTDSNLLKSSGDAIFNGSLSLTRVLIQANGLISSAITIAELDSAVTAITLPTSAVVSGRVLIIKDITGNATATPKTISTEGAETIDGAATLVLTKDFESRQLFSDGSNWFTSTESSTGGGGGGVTGPVSSTDNGVARWNGILGDTLNNSSFIVEDNGSVLQKLNSLAVVGVTTSTIINNNPRGIRVVGNFAYGTIRSSNTFVIIDVIDIIHHLRYF